MLSLKQNGDPVRQNYGLRVVLSLITFKLINSGDNLVDSLRVVLSLILMVKKGSLKNKQKCL